MQPHRCCRVLVYAEHQPAQPVHPEHHLLECLLVHGVVPHGGGLARLQQEGHSRFAHHDINIINSPSYGMRSMQYNGLGGRKLDPVRRTFLMWIVRLVSRVAVEL